MKRIEITTTDCEYSMDVDDGMEDAIVAQFRDGENLDFKTNSGRRRLFNINNIIDIAIWEEIDESE